MTQLRDRMLEELERRNYSPGTAKAYLFAIKQFADYFGKSPELLGGDEIREFETYLLRDKKLAPGTVEGRMSALRFLYEKTLKRRDIACDDLIFPKTPQKLPVVLSPEEVSRMIEAAPNLMHRTILMVLYATGIRRTEASLLKVTDVDSERMVIHVRQDKGARDRDVPMPAKLLEALREYWRWKRPKVYLFPSTAGHRGIEQPISKFKDAQARVKRQAARFRVYAYDDVHPEGREVQVGDKMQFVDQRGARQRVRPQTADPTDADYPRFHRLHRRFPSWS